MVPHKRPWRRLIRHTPVAAQPRAWMCASRCPGEMTSFVSRCSAISRQFAPRSRIVLIVGRTRLSCSTTHCRGPVSQPILPPAAEATRWGLLLRLALCQRPPPGLRFPVRHACHSPPSGTPGQSPVSGEFPGRIAPFDASSTHHCVKRLTFRACSGSRGVASRHGLPSGAETDMEGTMPWSEATRAKYRRGDDFRNKL